VTPRVKPRVLIVSSFVLPHAGGVEQFVARASGLLGASGAQVRVLACERKDANADAYLPTVFLGGSEWPVPRGGLRTLWREVGNADVVLLNSHRHLLTVATALIARLRGRRCLLAVHTADADAVGSPAYRLIARTFDRTFTRLAFAVTQVVTFSPAAAGLARSLGADPVLLPFPLPDIPPPRGRRATRDRGTPAHLVWVGRLSAEKDPLAAVAAVESLRIEVDAELEVYGDGPMHAALAELAESRPWLHLHGNCPRDLVLAAQRDADACIGSSLTESAHLAVLEALLQAVPTVATAVGDVPSYFAGRLAGFCVPAADSGALAAALADVLAAGDDEAFIENALRLQNAVADDGSALCSLVLGELTGAEAMQSRRSRAAA
jgi:glycosyltransferase involved in cell wall biosynthesis